MKLYREVIRWQRDLWVGHEGEQDKDTQDGEDSKFKSGKNTVRQVTLLYNAAYEMEDYDPAHLETTKFIQNR